MSPSERAIAHAEDNGWRYYERDMGYGRKRLGWHYEDDKGSRTLAGDGTESLDRMFDHDDQCTVCGQWIDHNTMRWEQLVAAGLCFTCDHYVQHAAKFDATRDVVLLRSDGTRGGYHIKTFGSSRSPSHCKGFGGQRWKLRFSNGNEVETDDLWCWSTDIPERFHDRFPVNAEVVRG